jgi:hypothetical protein
VTLGADGAGSAVPPLVAAAALLVETCASLAIQAARRGEFETARYLLEQALAAVTAQGRA